MNQQLSKVIKTAWVAVLIPIGLLVPVSVFFGGGIGGYCAANLADLLGFNWVIQRILALTGFVIGFGVIAHFYYNQIPRFTKKHLPGLYSHFSGWLS